MRGQVENCHAVIADGFAAPTLHSQWLGANPISNRDRNRQAPEQPRGMQPLQIWPFVPLLRGSRIAVLGETGNSLSLESRLLDSAGPTASEVGR